jgi:hypothetical protein
MRTLYFSDTIFAVVADLCTARERKLEWLQM